MAGLGLAGAGVLGGLGLGGTIATNKALKEEAMKNRKFQAAMTYAKYPLSVAGAKKAGLNAENMTPSFNTNAPSGSMASGLQNPASHILNALSGISSIEAQQNEIENSKKLTNANVKKADAETKNINADTKNNKGGNKKSFMNDLWGIPIGLGHTILNLFKPNRTGAKK